MANNCRVSITSPVNVDNTFYGSSSSNYALWDASANSFNILGTGAAFVLGTFSSLTAGNGATLSSSATGAVKIYTDDNGANIATSCRGLLSRTLLTVDQSGGSVRALMGQLKLKTGADVATGIYTASQGYVELAGTHSAQSGATFSCFDASLEIGTALTVDSGGEFFGVHVETTGSGTITNSGTCAAIGITTASGAANWPVGIYIGAGDVNKAIVVGALSSTTPGSGVTMDATTTRAVEVHVDDNNTARAVGTQARAIFGRTMIYADGACEDWGIHGLSKMSSVAKTGNVTAGVVGAFESTGTCSLATGSGNTYAAGVMGRVGGGGGFTINSGTWVSGLLAFYNTSLANAFTGNFTSGFHVATTDIASCGKWYYGVYVEPDAASVGAFLGNTLTPDSTRTNANLMIGGSRASAGTLTMAASANYHCDPIQMNYGIAGANPSNTATVNGFYQNWAHSTTNMANLRLKGADWTLDVQKNLQDAYVYQGEIDITTNSVTVGGEACAMGLTTSVTSAVTGNVWNTILVFSTDQTLASAATLFLSHRSTGTIGRAIYIEANSGTTLTDCIYLNAAGTITNFLSFASVAGPLSTSATALNGITTSHKLACRVGGTTFYIPLVTSGMS